LKYIFSVGLENEFQLAVGFGAGVGEMVLVGVEVGVISGIGFS